MAQQSKAFCRERPRIYWICPHAELRTDAIGNRLAGQVAGMVDAAEKWLPGRVMGGRVKHLQSGIVQLQETIAQITPAFMPMGVAALRVAGSRPTRRAEANALTRAFF
jgi:hypothetical protein